MKHTRSNPNFPGAQDPSDQTWAEDRRLIALALSALYKENRDPIIELIEDPIVDNVSLLRENDEYSDNTYFYVVIQAGRWEFTWNFIMNGSARLVPSYPVFIAQISGTSQRNPVSSYSSVYVVSYFREAVALDK